MDNAPLPKSEPRSAQEVQRLVMDVLTYEGPFHKRLLSDFTQVQSQFLLTSIDDDDDDDDELRSKGTDQLFIYDDNSHANQELMNNLFNKKLEDKRIERPVILLKVEEVAKEKKRSGDLTPISFNDLIYLLKISVEDVKNCSRDAEGLFPINTVKWAKTKHIPHSESIFHYEYDADVELAFEWGETAATGNEFSAFDSLLLGLSDSQYINRSSVLIPKSGVEIDKNRYGSPWLTKLSRLQLRALNPDEINRTLVQAHLLVDADLQNSRVRALVRPHGTGKTKMLQALERELQTQGVSEVVFINGADPDLSSLVNNPNAKIVFVDEAANLNAEDVVNNTQDDCIIVFFYPSKEAVTERLPPDKWPPGSYYQR